MNAQLLAPAFLFRFAVPCRASDKLWSARGTNLTPEHRIPCLMELQGFRPFAELRMGWSAAGLALRLEVTGKSQPLWCRPTRLEDSDGLQLWLDTRDTHNVHRAGRFCHRFVFMPAGAGKSLTDPVAQLLPINRCREMPKLVEPRDIGVRSEIRKDGYVLEAVLPGGVLTGWDTAEHPRLGFSYCVHDRELGLQPFSIGPEFPFDEDPSLWGTLELVK